MSFRAHSVLVHQGIKYLDNMLLFEHAIAASKVYQKATHLEDLIVKVVRYNLSKSRYETIKER